MNLFIIETTGLTWRQWAGAALFVWLAVVWIQAIVTLTVEFVRQILRYDEPTR